MSEGTRMTCVICPKSCEISAATRDGALEVAGAGCMRGEEYARMEIGDPRRVVTTTVRVKGGVLQLCPVRSSVPVRRNLLSECVRALAGDDFEAPVRAGDILVRNILGTGADIVATRDVPVDRR